MGANILFICRFLKQPVQNVSITLIGNQAKRMPHDLIQEILSSSGVYTVVLSYLSNKSNTRGKVMKAKVDNWKQVMELAKKYGFIVQAYGGTAILMCHEEQKEKGLFEKIQRINGTIK